MKIQPGKDDPKRISLKAATTFAVGEIATWPGEFGIHDVMGLARKYLRWKDTEGCKPLLNQRYHTPEWLAHGERMVREWSNVRLRKTFDEFDLRVYVCYTIVGQRRRHWLKMDHLSIKTTDTLLQDRNILVEDINRLRPYLVRGQEKMIARGPDTLFGDVKAEVVRELREEAS